MTYSLSQPKKVGQHVVAVLSRFATKGHVIGAVPIVLCEKTPVLVLVLVRRGEDVIALDMAGARVTAEQVDALCPDARRQLRSA